MRLKIGWVVAILAVTFLTQVSYAIPVTGHLRITGAIDVELDGTVTTLDFIPEDTGFGNFDLPGNSDGDFLGLIGTTGTIVDLNDTDHPTGAALNVPFLTFNADPDIVFNLIMILPGEFGSAACGAAPAAGQLCTPSSPSGGMSPFEFLNTSATSSTVSFEVVAEAVRISTGEITPYGGLFSATFQDQNFQAVLNSFFNDAQVSATYAADFTPNPNQIIPEPSTMNLLIGALFVGVGALTRKKFLGRN
jgi:hypothetical protein